MFVKGWTMTRSPNSTSLISRKGASLPGDSATSEKLLARFSTRFNLLLGHAGEERQRESVPRDRLRDRKRADPVAQPAIRRRQVGRLRVVAPGLDPPAAQEFLQLGPRPGPHNEQMPDRDASARDRRQAEVA